MTKSNELVLAEKIIRQAVDRFLSWKLPNDFNPDCGIHFDADEAKKLNPRNHRYEPVGTNLFTATQATEMVRYILGDVLLAKDTQIAEAEMRGRNMAVDYIEKNLIWGKVHMLEFPKYHSSILESARQENL